MLQNNLKKNNIIAIFALAIVAGTMFVSSALADSCGGDGGSYGDNGNRHLEMDPINNMPVILFYNLKIPPSKVVILEQLEQIRAFFAESRNLPYPIVEIQISTQEEEDISAPTIQFEKIGGTDGTNARLLVIFEDPKNMKDSKSFKFFGTKKNLKNALSKLKAEAAKESAKIKEGQLRQRNLQDFNSLKKGSSQ